MGMVCQICSHQQRLKIDRSLLGGESLRQISVRYSVSQGGLRRHKQNHLSRQLVKADENKRLFESKSLGEEVQGLIDKTKRILRKTERKGLHAVSLAAIRELRQTYGFLCEIALELKDRSDSQEAHRERVRQQSEMLKNLTREELLTLQAIYKKAGLIQKHPGVLEDDDMEMSARAFPYRTRIGTLNREDRSSNFVDAEFTCREYGKKVRHKIRRSHPY